MSVAALPARDVALESFFLGPRSENGRWLEDEVLRVLHHWFRWRTELFPADGRAISLEDQRGDGFIERRAELGAELAELMHRLESEVPKHSPRYVGHMVSETSLPALLGHLAAVLHNPNNVSAEVARVGAVLEREAIGYLLAMVGFDPVAGRGHFTSGGTVANIEALWRARYRLDHWLALGAWQREQGLRRRSLFEHAHQGWPSFRRELSVHGLEESDLRAYSLVLNNPWLLSRRLERIEGAPFLGPVVLAPRNKHYSWQKAVSLLGLGEEAFWEVELDARGTLDLAALRRQIERAQTAGRPILMVVSVAGTTEMGEVDPVHRVQDLLDELRHGQGLDIWHHVDAAYGGFFCTLLGEPSTRTALSAATAEALTGIRRVDSVTVDPHKLGYVPYSCGALLLRDPQHDRTSVFSAPYIHDEDGDGPAWSRTLEGSRPATGAAATWLTARTLRLDGSGLGRVLEHGVRARRELERALRQRVPGLMVAPGCDTNILCFAVGHRGETLSAINARSSGINRLLSESGQFHTSSTELDRIAYGKLVDAMIAPARPVLDAPALRLVRVVLMNPFVLSRTGGTDYLGALADGVAAAAAAPTVGLPASNDQV